MNTFRIAQVLLIKPVQKLAPRPPPAPGRHHAPAVRTLKTSEAAAVLNVSPNTLRSWERRFGYPAPQRTSGQHRVYTAGEVLALRDALREGLSIASAVSRAREAVAGDTGALTGALAALDPERADAALEASLALRSLERTVGEVLLPAVDEVGERSGTTSAPYALAATWAVDWLHRARRLSPPAPLPRRIVVGLAAADDPSPDRLALAAIELLVGRAGASTTTVPVEHLQGLSDVVERTAPEAALVVGSGATDDAVGRWVHRVRTIAGPVPVLVFRRGARDGRAGVHALPAGPVEAAAEVARVVLGATPARRAADPAPDAPLRRVAS
jgi:MerR family transcriptional regulator, light-induced transcriptional regulator